MHINNFIKYRSLYAIIDVRIITLVFNCEESSFTFSRSSSSCRFNSDVLFKDWDGRFSSFFDPPNFGVLDIFVSGAL